MLTVSAPKAFADNSLTVTVTVQGLPGGLATNVYINGNRNGTLAGGASATYTFPGSSAPYFISVDSFVQGSNNATRYYCQNTTWQTSTSGSQVFTYLTQYFLDVQTSYSSAIGQGWYAAGSTAQAKVNDQDVPEGQGTRNIFNGWSGDASGTQLTSSPIAMNGPKVAIANWKTQFFLTVEAAPGNESGLSGSGWYVAGTQANFSATPTIPVNATTRLSLDRWSGEFNGQGSSGEVMMDRPKTVIANYMSQYLLTVQYAPSNILDSYNDTHAGWYDQNSEVHLGPAPTVINLSPVERLQFTGWTDVGSVSTNPSYTVLVNKPRNITLSYATQYYLDVRSSYGTPSGSGWYNRGAIATITGPTSFGTWPITYTLTGWTVDPPNQALTDSDSSWTIVVTGPYVVQAQWSMNYLPLILLFGGVAAIGTAATAAVIGYKRGALNGNSSRLASPQKTRPSSPSWSSPFTCHSCGNIVRREAAFCEKCGSSINADVGSTLEQRVYDYVVNHEGVISLTKASSDLGMPVEQLKRITERLKADGRLS